MHPVRRAVKLTRDVKRGQMLEAEAKAKFIEAEKDIFTVKIYTVKTLRNR